MTRIIAGAAGGRRLQVPPAGTRPTSDRVREALFSAIGARMDLDGTRVLDLYAGSGAFALEALSRGAASAVLVESERKTAAVIRANIAAVALSEAQVRVGSVARVLAGGASGAFDLVFADPPYEMPTETVAADLTALIVHGWLAPDALIVLERSVRAPEMGWPSGYAVARPRRYGETRIESAEFVGHGDGDRARDDDRGPASV